MRDILKAMARQKEADELEEDVIVEEDLLAEESTGVDYYDEKGKIATLKRRRRWISDIRRKRLKPKEVDKDPDGRSFYYSTYRGKDFTPDHWRKQLPKVTQFSDHI